MADRYQDRPFPSDDDDDRGGEPHPLGRAESDPLAELARLIGQTDPFAGIGRANLPVQPRAAERERYESPAPEDEGLPAGPPPWMQRALRQEAAAAPQNYPEEDAAEDYPSAVHPLHRYAAAHPAPEPHYHSAPPFADPEHEPDPSRYDDALYGQLDSGAQDPAHDQAYADDPYGYQDGYDDGAEDQVKKRRGGMATVAIVLALAVVGTGAAFAYRTYVGSPRSGDPPIIKADTNPTKIVPAAPDGSGKLPDRMAASDGTEKIVPREEVPVDVNAKAGPRVVFPPLNQNGNQPPMASVGAPPPVPSGGTLPSSEPHKIKTFSVRGDQPDGAAVPVTSAPPAATKPAPAPRATVTPAPGAPRTSTSNANAASPNAPLSLSPQASQPAAPAPAAESHTRIAANNPVQIAPPATPGATGGGNYLVQVSSQRNEADAQASYKALQGKFPAVLGSRPPVIKRADLGDKGVYYRAMVGPFGSPDEASQFCRSLKTAGGQCVVQRN
jgi:SPOR domain